MGLDWNPENKPKPGYEKEFERLFHALQRDDGLRERNEQRFFEISTTAFETLRTPRVGESPAADEWAREIYRSEPRDQPEDVWIEGLRGFYVLDLVPPCDGVPRYSNGLAGGDVERYSFRAQFLRDCEHIIGAELLEAAYTSRLAPEFEAYGHALQRKFDAFVAARGLDAATLESDDPESAGFQADVVGSAARWCLFWARRGHVLDAYW
jgi:hypothetical protein